MAICIYCVRCDSQFVFLSTFYCFLKKKAAFFWGLKVIYENVINKLKKINEGKAKYECSDIWDTVVRCYLTERRESKYSESQCAKTFFFL